MGRGSEARNRKKTKKVVMMDGPNDGPTDSLTNGPPDKQTNGLTKRDVESRSTQLKITSHPRIAHGQRYLMPCLE